MFNLFTLSFIGAVVLAISVLIIHILRKDLKTTRDALSKYAIGNNGWVLTLGLYSMGFAQILLSLALIKKYDMSLGFLLLGLAGVGILLVAFFKMELTKKKSVKGYLHDTGAIMEFFFFPVSLLLFNGVFENSNLSVTSIIIGYVALLFFIIITYFYLRRATYKTEYYGVIQKLNISFITIWMIFIPYVLM